MHVFKRLEPVFSGIILMIPVTALIMLADRYMETDLGHDLLKTLWGGIAAILATERYIKWKAGQDLYDKFRNAILAGSNEDAAIALKDIILKGLHKTLFFGVNLSTLKFQSIVMNRANLSYANLSKTVLKEGKFVRAKLRFADLTGANLTGSDFSKADLTGADLRNTNLRGVNFSEAILTGVNFDGAILYETIFAKANLAGADLRKIKNLTCEYLDFTQAKMTKANLSGIVISNSSFDGANARRSRMNKTKFVACIFNDAVFTNINADEASFDRCTYEDVNFERASLRKASFRQAEQSHEWINGSFAYSDMREVHVPYANFMADFTGTDFTGAIADTRVDEDIYAGAYFHESSIFTKDTRLPDGRRWNPQIGLGTMLDIWQQKK